MKGRLFPSDCQCCGHDALQVFEFFQKRIATQYPLTEDNDSNPFTHTRDAHEAFLRSRSDSVIGRMDVLHKVWSGMLLSAP